jgi:citrate/tricarballylate utilization protein
MHATDSLENTIWQLEVCNACRYCEGYCAVFPALERRRSFTTGDVEYLANLCHDCRACFYACMYAPPHEFGVNLPKALAEVRVRTYEKYALPRVASDLAQRNLWLIGIVTALGTVFLLALVAATGDPSRLFAVHEGPGSFYAVVPNLAMAVPAMVISLYVLAVLVLGGIKFVRATHASPRDFLDVRALVEAGADALNLRYLRGGAADGCYYPDERASDVRRILHLLVVYGFGAAFVATVLAYIAQDWLGILPPYPVVSPPVVFGSLGGIAMIVGTSGLLYLKRKSDPAPASRQTVALDYLFLVSLDIVSVTGMLTLALRSTPAMGIILVIHLATVFALYVSAPYGKFAHFVYRYAALVQDRIERRELAERR